MAFQSLIQKYKTAERWLSSYSDLYWYQVDWYELDESQKLMFGEDADYGFYVDKVVNFFKMLPKKTIGVRILPIEPGMERETLGHILVTEFEIAVPDVVLRDAGISPRVGDVIASAGVFDELAELESFDQFTKPVFVRFVQEIKPATFVLMHNNVLEWRIRVSESDVVFRYAV